METSLMQVIKGVGDLHHHLVTIEPTSERKVVVVLRSNNLNHNEWQFLLQTLLTGDILIISVHKEALIIATLLQNAWVKFTRKEDQEVSILPPYTLKLGDIHDELGQLVFIVPPEYYEIFDWKTGLGGNGFPSSQRFLSSSRFLPHLDFSAPRSDLSSAQLPKDYRIMGYQRKHLTMKDIYFLHNKIQGERSGRLLSWEKVRQILLEASKTKNPLLTAAFDHHDAINDDILDTIAEAMEVLTREGIAVQPSSENIEIIDGKAVEPSIYHLLWRCHSWGMDGKYIFRGQRDCRWRQDSSLFRGIIQEDQYRPPDLGMILERLCRTQTFMNYLGNSQYKHLSDEYKLAIAQHYGMPTPLVDYTKSLDVAAFFATGAGHKNELSHQGIGVIYVVDDKPKFKPPKAPQAIDVITSTGLEIGKFQSIDFQEEESVTVGRIKRQHGVFIKGFDSYLLQRLTTKVLYFRQSEPFEDPFHNIYEDHLMGADEDLENIAEQCKNIAAADVSLNPEALSSLLRLVRIPSDDIFGSLGLSLGLNLRKAQYFLNEIWNCENNVGGGFVRDITEILRRHFNEARITSRTSGAAVLVRRNSSAPLSSSLEKIAHKSTPNDVQATLVELAEVAHMEVSEFMKIVTPYRPNYTSFEFRDLEPVANKKENLAVAVAIFVIGLEHMRTAGGAEAYGLFSGAEAKLFHIQR